MPMHQPSMRALAAALAALLLLGAASVQVVAQEGPSPAAQAAAAQRNAAQTASWLLTRATEVNGTPLITQAFPDGDAEYLQAVVDAVKSRFKGVIVVGGAAGGSVTLIASVTPDFTAKVQAGKIIQAIAPIVGGKGGARAAEHDGRADQRADEGANVAAVGFRLHGHAVTHHAPLL